MGHLTDFVRRETVHLTPIIVDGTIGVLTPTLTAFVIGAEELVKHADADLGSWTILLAKCAVVALTALGAFRSQAYGRWKDEKKQSGNTVPPIPKTE